MANPRICSIPDCGKPVLAREWCSIHYDRWRAHGDPLGEASPTPARLFYDHVALVYSGDRCVFWPFVRNNKGYPIHTIGGVRGLVTRNICEAVHGSPPTPKHEAAHSCGNGHLGCVTKRHLSWKTRAENIADRITHGTHVQGEKQGNAKLTEADVREILELKGAASQRHIAKQYGVNQSAISEIHNGRSWRFLTSKPTGDLIDGLAQQDDAGGEGQHKEADPF